MKKIILSIILLITYCIVFAESYISLETAIEIAKENNASLKSAYYDMQAARWSSLNSKTQFLPKINFSETAIIYDKEKVFTPEIDLGVIVIPSMKQDKNNFISAVQIEQVLFAGGRIYNAGKIADLQYQISKNNYQKQLSKLSVEVSETYYQILKIQSKLQILDNQKLICQEIKRNAEVLKENGLGLETDIMQWELRLIEIENQIIQLESVQKVLIDAWSILLGADNLIPETSDLQFVLLEIKDFTSLTKAEKETKMQDFLSMVQSGNPDLQNLQKSRQTLNHLVKISRAEFLPTIFASFNYEIENDNKLNLRGDENWQIMANISIPIFHSGRNYTQYNAQKYQTKSQLKLIEESSEGLMIVAKQAWYDLENSANSILQAEKSYLLAERALNITRSLFMQGMTTNLSLTEAQKSFQAAQLHYTNSLYDYTINKNNLSKFTGVIK